MTTTKAPTGWRVLQPRGIFRATEGEPSPFLLGLADPPAAIPPPNLGNLPKSRAVSIVLLSAETGRPLGRICDLPDPAVIATHSNPML